MKNLSLLALLLTLFCQTALSAEKIYQLEKTPDGQTGISFTIGYTLGTHNGIANEATGLVIIEDSTSAIVKSEFSVPIDKINSFNTQRDCHLREALGLDYNLSVYPEAQACSNDNSLPTTGNDSIQFPTIKFALVTSVAPKKSGEVQAVGLFTLHGIQKQISVPLVVTGTPDGKLKVSGQFDLSLSDYGIIVRKVLFVTVKDTAHVALELTLSPSRK